MGRNLSKNRPIKPGNGLNFQTISVNDYHYHLECGKKFIGIKSLYKNQFLEVPKSDYFRGR
jgi:hypothetical protein